MIDILEAVELQWIIAGLLVTLAVLAYRLVQLVRRRAAPRHLQALFERKREYDARIRDESEERTLDEPPPRRPGFLERPTSSWIIPLSGVLACTLIATFEHFVPSLPTFVLDRTASVTLKAPYPFTFDGRAYATGEVLVEKNQPVSAWHAEMLRSANAQRRVPRLTRLLGYFGVFAIFAFLLAYQIHILISGRRRGRVLALIFLLVTLLVLTAKLVALYSLFSPYYLPIASIGMLVTILVNRRVAPLTILVSVLYMAVVAQFDFQLILMMLAAGLISGSWVRQAKKRSQVLLASFLVGVANCLVLAAYWAAGDSGPLKHELAPAFLGGIVSGFLTLLFLPLLEILLDVTSPFQLMELADLNAPILREFFIKAPGTYQHSIAVANLAEILANEIHANGLLARVGAYYHDIGKIFNPSYFIENQHGENPHDQIGPVASSAMVRSHVIYGERLARKLGLPEAVIDMIPQHHGTSTIDYFYFKSRQQESTMQSTRVFKYPGPRPQSKEAGILMIVDSVEAAFRVLEVQSDEKIREVVEKVVQRKFSQGQLDDTGLTVGELKTIMDMLTQVLIRASHKRVSYPAETGVSSEAAREPLKDSTGRPPVPPGEPVVPFHRKK